VARIRPFGRETPPDAAGREDFPEIDGSSPAVLALKRDMCRVARDPHVTVLITGESGTGKERVAEAIHRASPRRHAPFVVIDCAGIPATLAEDTLFGHVRGAFTGAVAERAGPFERADGGTVLLDEIGDLPLDVQMKLLRAIQSRTVQRVGGSQARSFDARIMAATHVDLAGAVARGRFREDLYYRLGVYDIHVPPLRRRGPGDVRLLVSTILTRLAASRRRPMPSIDGGVLDVLTRHDWPGNVRELENAIERMFVAADGDALLRAAYLPRRLRSAGSSTGAVPLALPGAEAVLDALTRCGFRYGRTARALGLSRHQLYRLVKRHGLRRADR
jgi:DNA-binding NtrC family response regulator